MSDAAAPSPSAAPSQNTPQSQNGTDTKDWVRPQPHAANHERVTSPQPKKEPPAETRKPAETSKDGGAAARKENDTSKTKEPAEDDDPEEELEDSRGEKFKLRRSEIRKRAARAAEIERESQKRFQTTAEARRDLEAREQRIKGLFAKHGEDPWAMQRAVLMERDGLTAEQADAKLDEIAEARLVRQMQQQRMTPEQIEHEKLKAENAQLKADAEKREADEKAAKREKLKAEHRHQWDKVIGSTITDHKLPPTRRTAARIAQAISDHATTDPQTGKVMSIPPAIAARIVRDEIHTELRTELQQLAATSPAAALELLGADLVKWIVQQEAKKHQDFVPQGGPKQPPPVAPKPPINRAPPTLEEARKKLGVRHY